MTDNKEYDYRVVESDGAFDGTRIVGGDVPLGGRRIVRMQHNTLNDHIEKAARECGFGSYVYARMKETNYILGSIDRYPVVVRSFFETITPTDLDRVYRRAARFLFCDDLGSAEPDTVTQVMPLVEEMIDRSADFFQALGRRGLEVNVQRITPFVARFDQLVCGVECEVSILYSTC